MENPTDILDRNSRQGKKIEYFGKWNGMDVGVVLRVKEDNTDFFTLSIVSPFFNVNREIVRKDVLKEMDKVYAFLNYTPQGETPCPEKNTDASAPQNQQSVNAS